MIPVPQTIESNLFINDTLTATVSAAANAILPYAVPIMSPLMEYGDWEMPNSMLLMPSTMYHNYQYMYLLFPKSIRQGS